MYSHQGVLYMEWPHSLHAKVGLNKKLSFENFLLNLFYFFYVKFLISPRTVGWVNLMNVLFVSIKLHVLKSHWFKNCFWRGQRRSNSAETEKAINMRSRPLSADFCKDDNLLTLFFRFSARITTKSSHKFSFPETEGRGWQLRT